MRNKLYGLRDTKIGEIVRVYVEDNHVEACRQMQYAVMAPENKVAQYPSEHEIVYLGQVDNVTGAITAPNCPEFVINGLQARSAAIERKKMMENEHVGDTVKRLEDGIGKMLKKK